MNHSDHLMPPAMNMSGGGGVMNATHPRRMMMHMTFYWGSEALVLFKGWPGTRPGMYALSLMVVFALAFLVEWISGSRLIGKDTGRVAAGLIRTAMHAVRVGVAYMVMLAVMSFNVGVFLAAVAGHGLGFLVFGSKVFDKDEAEAVGYRRESEDRRDLPPMSC
ncbi:Copper transporter 1 [Linum grandiflorum]